VPGGFPATWPAVGPLAADGASERVTGSPSPGSSNRTVRGLPGYRAVLFGRAAVVHPAGPPSARPSASGSAAFRECDPLSIRNLLISGLLSCGPPARLATLQPRPRGRRLQAWLPACWLRFGWGRVGHRRGIGRRTGSRCCRPLLGTRRCLNPCLDPFPVSPTIIPDGGISPVRLEAKAYPRAAFPDTRNGLSDGAHTPSAAGLLHVSSGP
jgi:hypothetical protein